MATQARTAYRKTRWSTPPPRPSSTTHPQPYRRRRPETTTLHRIIREHLETYLANEADPVGDGVPDHVEKEFRSYLKWRGASPAPPMGLVILTSSSSTGRR